MNAATLKTAPFHDKLPPASMMRALVSASGKDSRCEPPRLDGLVQGDLLLDINWAGVLHNFPLLTVKEAATELHCSDQHIRNFVDDGKLLAFQINIADLARRADYRIVRQTAARAFQFFTANQRHESALAVLRTVDRWLFAPYDPNLGAWQPALRIGNRSVLTVDETAQALRCTGTHVRELYDAQHLRALNVGAAQSVAQPLHLRIARESLVAFVTIRLARQNNIKI